MVSTAGDGSREGATDQLDRLERIIQTQSLIVQADLDLEQFMDLAVEAARELTAADAAVIELVEGAELVYHTCTQRVPEGFGLRLARDRSLSGECLRQLKALRCDDTETDPRVDRAICRQIGARAMVVTPLVRNGVPIGVLKVLARQPARFAEADVRLLELLGGTLATALVRQLANDESQRAEARLRGSEERLRMLLEHAHDAVVSIDDAGTVTLWNRSAERLFGWAPIEALGRHVGELIVPPALRADLERMVAGFAASENLDDVHQRVTLPAVDRSGSELAVELSLSATRVGGRWELTAFAHDVSRRRELEMQLREMALCDGLTGLANRRAFMDALEKAVSRACRLGHPVALLFLDLDDFKAINDCFGHAVGDAALQVFARRVRHCVRVGDTVARLGGDEFTVLAEGVASIDQAQAIADKIMLAMEEPLGFHGLVLRASIGISVYRPPADASEFLSEADRAMYRAKRADDYGVAAADTGTLEAAAQGE